ncbi:TPA: HK97 gp10 family phage protein [Streptococcus suis]|nr:HK97 gp10 family phage protein [Streptococcus suis]
MGIGSVSSKTLKVDLSKQIQEIIQKAARDTENDIRTYSPHRNGTYEDGWTHTIIGDTAVIHNAGKEKSLTHLLENGHATKNGGFVGPQEHIRPAYLKNKEKYLNDLKSIKIKAQ